MNKQELCDRLTISRPTLDAWMRRWGDSFPVAEHGGNGRSYRFDFSSVVTFLKERKEEEAAAAAERDEQLAQLVLPFVAPIEGVGPSLEDQLRAERLIKARRDNERAEEDTKSRTIDRLKKSGELVEVAQIRDLGRSFMLNLAQDMHAFLNRLGREQGWPGPVLQSYGRALDELMQKRADAEIAMLRPATSNEANGTEDELL